jgi:hypothetical protein
MASQNKQLQLNVYKYFGRCVTTVTCDCRMALTADIIFMLLFHFVMRNNGSVSTACFKFLVAGDFRNKLGGRARLWNKQ